MNVGQNREEESRGREGGIYAYLLQDDEGRPGGGGVWEAVTTKSLLAMEASTPQCTIKEKGLGFPETIHRTLNAHAHR